MKCFFGCDIEWELNLQKLSFTRVDLERNIEHPFLKSIQQGKCKKCAKIYCREVKIK